MILPTTLTIPLAFRTPPAWPEDRDPLALEYTIAPYQPTTSASAIQPVLRDRLVATLRIDLNNYRCRAEIDWLEIRLTTPDRHQARNMQPAIAKMLGANGFNSTVFVSGPRREKGYIGQEFILKFQQPQPGELGPIMEWVLAKYAPVSVVEDLPLAGIEISIDFYVLKSATMEPWQANLRRWQMVDILRRHLRPEEVLTEMEMGRPRFFGGPYGGDGATFFVNPSGSDLAPTLIPWASRLGMESHELVALDHKKHNQPFVDTTAYIGPKDFIVSLRSMDKTTDKRNPDTDSFEILEPHRRRARLEVTLQGEADEKGGHGAIELCRMADLHEFRFQQQIRKPIFEFFLPTFGPTCDTATLGFPVKITELVAFGRSGTYGLDRLHKTVEAAALRHYERGRILSEPVKLGKKGRLVSWTQMNQKIDRALRKLGRTWTG